jgi:hypothetical protein
MSCAYKVHDGWTDRRSDGQTEGQTNRRTVHPFFHPSIYPSVHLYVLLSVRPSVCPSVCPSVHLSVPIYLGNLLILLYDINSHLFIEQFIALFYRHYTLSAHPSCQWWTILVITTRSGINTVHVVIKGSA